MWAEAAKWLNKFDEAVLTVLDSDGYPASVRVEPRSFDAATGQLQTTLPDELRAVEGPANLLCHYHDEKLWSLRSIEIKGRLENRDGTWVFVSTTFKAPSKLALLIFLKGTRVSAQKYLDKRGFDRPSVNWLAAKEIRRRAKAKNG